ncbi:radical SAM protein [Anaerocolumna sp. AGMB13025]|uniref:radical SAM protein n=1 Tax=Anaerocolumna sp. AGMB13025 TaxID=3039116 RepID=UPI00241D1E1C|nr:radical SAM protein [Anaerocolumna sp. AGMB13025]WFR55435.1 radical SAM protein [Anaerocolumna sp. AGMB13025]
MIPKIANSSNIRTILKGRIPGQVIIQYTNSCNATCPQCSMRKTEPLNRVKLEETEVRKIIESAARQKIQALSFTGGEPFLYQEQLISLIQYASDLGIPYIRTGTNGFMFANTESNNYVDKIERFAERLSRTNLRNFWISIDSSDPKTHEEMRGLKGVISGIEKALPIFHQYGIYPAANLGINRYTGGKDKIPYAMADKDEFYDAFKTAFEGFYEFVINLGFTMVNACYPMSFGGDGSSSMKAVYGAVSDSDLITFTKEEKIQLFRALMDTIPTYRSKIRIFTPLVSLYSLIQQFGGKDNFSYPCRGGIDFFYINAKDGNTYPCGYRGDETMGKFIDLDVAALRSKPFCKACDWECFRDPSELIGYVIHSLHNPIRYLTNGSKDSLYRHLWKEDIKYYELCEYFDGRKAMKTT